MLNDDGLTFEEITKLLNMLNVVWALANAIVWISKAYTCFAKSSEKEQELKVQPSRTVPLGCVDFD